MSTTESGATRRYRNRDRTHRQVRVNVRLSIEEYAKVERAASEAGWTTTGYVARAALAAAESGQAPHADQVRAIISALLAKRTEINRRRAGRRPETAPPGGANEPLAWPANTARDDAAAVAVVDMVLATLRKRLR